jgi:hypothetical protein
MKKAVDVSKEINDIRKLPANKKCFECGEIGTTYIVQDFGIFVCSGCAGIHREFNHRVKGLSMSNFALAELEVLRTQGNEVCLRTWMARYNPRDFPQPGPKDTQRIKDFIRLKYRERRWYQEQTSETQAVSPPTTVDVKAPRVLSGPAVSAAPTPQVTQDLLSLGETKPQTSGNDGWGEFQSTNQVNIQISFQQPKPEETKIPEPVSRRQEPFYPPTQPASLPVNLPVYPTEPARPTINPQVLQQQFYVQSQTYLQLYGVPYPFNYQAWCQLAYPRPPM